MKSIVYRRLHKKAVESAMGAAGRNVRSRRVGLLKIGRLRWKTGRADDSRTLRWSARSKC